MVHWSLRRGAGTLALIVACLVAGGFSGPAGAVPLPGTMGETYSPLNQGLLHRTDTFRKCQEIYWCGVRRDGRPYCGPAQRCRTCKYVRTCSKATGCVWEEKCRWGPYIPPQPQ